MIEIREPKYKVGEKVTTLSKVGEVFGTIARIKCYDFPKGTYIYTVKFERDGFTEELHLDELVLDAYTDKQKTVWDLEEGEECYSLTICGNVHHGFWDGSSSSIEIRDTGGIFLTKAEAEFEVERRKVETEMLRLGGRRHLKLHKENYCFCFDSQFSSISCECFSCLGICSSIYFDSEKEALKALNTIGKDKIKKYIFGVEE